MCDGTRALGFHPQIGEGVDVNDKEAVATIISKFQKLIFDHQAPKFIYAKL